MTGLGPTNLPKPVKVTHYLSKPIQPPPMSEDSKKFNDSVEKFHEYCQAEMRRMLHDGEKRSDAGAVMCNCRDVQLWGFTSLATGTLPISFPFHERMVGPSRAKWPFI